MANLYKTDLHLAFFLQYTFSNCSRTANFNRSNLGILQVIYKYLLLPTSKVQKIFWLDISHFYWTQLILILVLISSFTVKFLKTFSINDWEFWFFKFLSTAMFSIFWMIVGKQVKFSASLACKSNLYLLFHDPRTCFT